MKVKQLLAAALLFCTAGASAQTDVTSTYITNAGFDESSDWVTGNIANTAATSASAVTGWTRKGADSWTYGGSLQFGGSGKINNVSIPSTNSDGAAEGGALALSGAWDGGNGWIAYTQDVTLPAGNYVLTIPVNNVGKNDKMKTDNAAQSPNLFNFTTNDNVYSGTVTSFPVDTWTTNTIRFSLASETSGTLSLGLRWVDTGSGNTPKLVIDYVKAMYTNYTETLQSTIDRATVLNARASDTDLANAITTAQGVLDGADNTVAYQTTIDNAVTNLRSAISTAAAKIVLLEGENITFMFENADFESSTPVTGGITTYDYDAAANATSFSRMQVVEGWTIVENGNAKSAGIYQFDSGAWLGSKGNNYQVPASGSATGEEKALGIVAVWSSSAQYKQACTLPAGSYILEIPVYNTAGTTAFAKNLIGFVENGGKEHLATAKTYATGSWITEKVIFELENETSGYLSLGYTATNSGSGAMPHLFIDNVKVTYTSPIAAAYQKYQVALEAANEAIANTDYANVTGSERTALQNAIDATPEQTKEAYNNAADKLDASREAFTAAKANYDAFVAAKATVVPDLTYAAAAKKTTLEEAIAATATSSDDAATKATDITTALRAYYESHAMAEGVDGAADYSSAVADANAEPNTGWTNGVGTNQGQGYTDSEGNVASKYLDGGWASNAGANIDMTRTVEIPAGKYLLTVKARGAVDLTVYTLSIAGETIDLPHANGGSNGVFGNGWEDASIEFESDGKAQTLEVIANSEANQQWFSMNDFRLVCLEINNDAYAGTTEYAALNSAISDAEAKTLGFGDGEYAPYNNVAALKALAAAKAVDQTAELTNLKTEVEAITEALTSATWTANDGDVDAIYNGLFATVTEGANYPDGWARTNSWGQMQSGLEGDFQTAYYNQPGSLKYGNQGVYTMPLAANTAYQLVFYYRSHENNSNNGITVSVLNGEGEGLSAVTFDGNGSISEWAAARAYFTTGAAGNYVLTLANNGNTWMTDVSLTTFPFAEMQLADDEDYTFNFDNTYMEKVKLTRKVVEGYNTVCMPFSLTAEQVKEVFGENAQVYTYQDVADGTNSTINFNTKEDNTIAANVPVLVGNATASNEEKTFNGVILKSYTGDSPVVTGTNFDFVGTYAASTDIAAGDYFIGNGAIYKSEGATSIKAFRAYIKAKGASGEVKLFIDGGLATGIDEINGTAVENGAIYNLAGQRVNKAQKGIYIVNGKKVAVK